MPSDDQRMLMLRLRVGMAAVAALNLVFWAARLRLDPDWAHHHTELRLAIVGGALVFLAFTYLPVAKRLARPAALLGGAWLIVAHTWLAAASGMTLDYALPPVLLAFAVGAVAASPGGIVVFLATTVVSPVALTLAYGWKTAQPPLLQLVLFLSAGVGGALVSWLRLRSQAVLTREIQRRRAVEAELRAARAHLESILHATSDGLLGVRYVDGGPRITFANRRFGEIFGLDPGAIVGQADAEVRAQAASCFRDPDAFERDVRRLYDERDQTQTTELELVHPRRALIERWTGPIADGRGAIVGRIWSFRDVTAQRAMAREREEYAARLEATNAQLARASQAKDAFLANLSHELRTPLSVIIGYQNLLLEGGISPEESRDFLQRSTASAVHLLRVISDMLDLTRLEAGSAEVTLEPLEVAPLVHEVRDLTEVLANAKGLTLRVLVDPAARVLADGQRLKQILLNLVGNAVKFTGEGRVTISAAARNGRVHFAVQDTGCGIPPEKQALLFQKFMRLDTRMNACEEGVGLGLSICRELVALMGGEIELESRGAGRGTEVRFTLPRAE